MYLNWMRELKSIAKSYAIKSKLRLTLRRPKPVYLSQISWNLCQSIDLAELKNDSQLKLVIRMDCGASRWPKYPTRRNKMRQMNGTWKKMKKIILTTIFIWRQISTKILLCLRDLYKVLINTMTMKNLEEPGMKRDFYRSNHRLLSGNKLLQLLNTANLDCNPRSTALYNSQTRQKYSSHHPIFRHRIFLNINHSSHKVKN